MAVRKVLQIGHPALKAKNRKIRSFTSPKTSKLIRDLRDTMRKNDLIGIAAPQIAENYQVFVTEPRKTKARKLVKGDEFRVYINPQITYFSKVQNLVYEGCGSVIYGQLFGPVKRPKTIEIESFDPSGKKFLLKSDGILARVIQHEYDHLSGIEFTEIVEDYRKLMNADYYKKSIRNSKSQLSASKITQIKYKLLS